MTLSVNSIIYEPNEIYFESCNIKSQWYQINLSSIHPSELIHPHSIFIEHFKVSNHCSHKTIFQTCKMSKYRFTRNSNWIEIEMFEKFSNWICIESNGRKFIGKSWIDMIDCKTFFKKKEKVKTLFPFGVKIFYEFELREIFLTFFLQFVFGFWMEWVEWGVEILLIKIWKLLSNFSKKNIFTNSKSGHKYI
jgi:hypothetical protein